MNQAEKKAQEEAEAKAKAEQVAADKAAEKKAQEEAEAKAKAEQVAADKAAEKKAQEEAEAKAKAEAKKKGFFIAEGKSMTSKKGILAPGAEVKPEFVSGGQETIDFHVKRGTIVEVK